MAISLYKPLAENQGICKAPMKEETIKIFIPPKPNMNRNASSEMTVNLSNMMMAPSSKREEDLSSSKLPFVWKLYEMLEDVESTGKEDIISWVDEGKAFKVHKLKAFVDEIIPKYFKQSKYKSFQRQLYFYEFTRTASGPNAGAYSHPKFVRGVKTLCLSMAPKKSRSSKQLKRKESPSKLNTVPRGLAGTESKQGNAEDPSEWMTQMENLLSYGAAPPTPALQQRRQSSQIFEQAKDPTSLERAGPSDGDIVFVFGGKPFHFVETQFDDLPC